jgi:acyl-CoA thioester hydrolase
MVEARLRVIYGDTDQMGVVYYANYFRYFEFARAELIRARGGSYGQIERDGSFLPVVEATCRYKAPARYDDAIVVQVAVSELRNASVAFSYEVRREGDPQILCTGSTLHACVGRDGRPMRLPDTLTRLLSPS